MPDEIDANLRRHLWGSAAEWTPTGAIESTRVELHLRVRRRRRAQALMAATALASVTFLVALDHVWTSGAASGHLTADPPPISRPGGGHGGMPGTGSNLTTMPASAPGGRSARSPAGAGQAGRGGGAHPTSAPSAPGWPAVATTTTTTTTVGTVAGPPSSVPPTSSTTPATVPTTTTLPASTTTTTLTPGTSTTLPTEYVFTNSDSGTLAQVPHGATIKLDLVACAGTTWSPVHSSAPGVVAPVSTAPNPAVGSISDTLMAVTQGTAVLRVHAHLTCPLPSAVFIITIEVT